MTGSPELHKPFKFITIKFLDMYFGDLCFESRSCYVLSWVRFSWLSSVVAG